MANYATLKAAIQQVVKTNGNNEITGALLQQSLLAMVNSLGNGFLYAGIATPTTNPGTPDQNVFYLASTAGTYSNFGPNEWAILKYNGTWTKETSGFASAELVNEILLGTLGKTESGTSQITVGTTLQTTAHTIYGDFKTGDKFYVKITKGTANLTRWYGYGWASPYNFINFGAKTTFGEYVEIKTKM